MKTAIFLFLLLVATTSAFEQCGKKGSGSRIIGGKDAGHGEFPWQISLRIDPSIDLIGHICGGTLLNNQYVLCAAHCFVLSKKTEDYTVRIGEWNIKQDDGSEQDFDVTEIHLHEGYNDGVQYNNDIALLKLAKPVDFSGPYAGPACLPEKGKDYREHKDCILSGWGLTKLEGKEKVRAVRLQKMTGPIWKDRKLVFAYYFLTLPDHVIGFGQPYKGILSCQGDSGGPLVCPNGGGGGAYDVVGIVSFGAQGCKGKPGVFTEVSAYRDWLTEKSGGQV